MSNQNQETIESIQEYHNELLKQLRNSPETYRDCIENNPIDMLKFHIARITQKVSNDKVNWDAILTSTILLRENLEYHGLLDGKE